MKWVKGIGATAIVSLIAVIVGLGLLGAVAFFKAGGSRKEADEGRKQVPPPPRPKPPISLSAPVEFQMKQRSNLALPGSDGKIVVTIGDITGGQVLTTVSWHDGRTLVATRSIQPNDAIRFSIDGHAYRLRLKDMRNFLIGDDTASFVLSRATTEGGSKRSESDKIERLITLLNGLTGASFVRNGKTYRVEEAGAHMRMKWDWKGAEIKTAEDFIRIIASRSSVSGKPYLIRWADGTEMSAEEWFRKQLRLMEP